MSVDVDFNEIPDWVYWIAQDSDGVWWGYQVEPNLSHKSWYENEVGDSIKLKKNSKNFRLGINFAEDWVNLSISYDGYLNNLLKVCYKYNR